jgi:hypothetical protein
VTTPEGTRRLVRTIVCSYTIDELPVSWLRVFHRLEREVARAGLRIRVQLSPLEQLPDGFEVLVVPPSLLERAESLHTGARIIATTRERAPAAVDELMRELESEESLYADHVTPGEPKIRVHRGPDVL